MSRKTYSYEEKVRALKMLESLDFNTTKASKVLHISRIALESWEEQLGGKVFKKDREEKIIKEIVDEFDAEKKKFVEKAWELKGEILDRIKELIPDEKSLFTLATVLKVIHEVTESKSFLPLDENSPEISVFQQINQQITNNLENVHKIKSKGKKQVDP
jgi:hypothetical protein